MDTLLMEAAAGISGGRRSRPPQIATRDTSTAAQELVSHVASVTGDYREILSRADVDAVVSRDYGEHWPKSR